LPLVVTNRKLSCGNRPEKEAHWEIIAFLVQSHTAETRVAYRLDHQYFLGTCSSFLKAKHIPYL
jgi:uncharacterized protein YtpQ (UPF0354 family)